jgi:mono/diheme cytochrome c family protein
MSNMKQAPFTSSPARARRLAAAFLAASALFTLVILSACRGQNGVVAEQVATGPAAASTPVGGVAAATPAPGATPAAASPAPVGPSGPSPVSPSGLSLPADQAEKPDQNKREIPPSMMSGSDPKKVEEFMKSFKPTPTPPPAPTPKVEVVNGKIVQQWQAPTEFAALANPVKNNPGAAKKGREFYSERCEICHGKLGRGDGAWARNFSKVPTNLASKVVQANTDGELFYKVTNARAPHPASKVRFTDEERWYIVSYLRTFK